VFLRNTISANPHCGETKMTSDNTVISLLGLTT
jgi:hypothetical protein